MIIIDYKDRRPIYEQVVERIEDLIVKGVLKEDTQLPSVRQLAMEISINPNTIQRAYSEMERSGSIYSVKGKGSFIAHTNKLMQSKKDQIFVTLKGLVKDATLVNIGVNEFIDVSKQYFLEMGGN